MVCKLSARGMIALIVLVLPFAAWGQGTLTTVAGSTFTFPTVPGTGTAATTLPLGGIADVAVDSTGNVVVAGQTGSIDFPTAAAFVAKRPGLLN